MPDWIMPLTPELSVTLVGRKAAALSQLAAAGFPVPWGVCITTSAFKAAQELPGDLHLPAGLLDALVAVLPTSGPLAVRSSAVLEDLPEKSLAGRFSSSLNVNGKAALEQAVLDCWRSYLSFTNDPGMAVLVQPLVDAECAGVCFTVDPVRQREDLMLVTSCWALER